MLFSRTLIIAAAVSLAFSLGCKRPDSDSSQATSPSEASSGTSARGASSPGQAAPTDPTSATLALLHYVPSEADTVIVLRNYEELFAFLPSIRQRLPSHAGMIAQIEADLKASLGVQALDANSAVEFGLHPDGALLTYVDGDQAVLMAQVRDHSVFARSFEDATRRFGGSIERELDETQTRGHVYGWNLPEEEERIAMLASGNIVRFTTASIEDSYDDIIATFENPPGDRYTDQSELRSLLRSLENYSLVFLGEVKDLHESFDHSLPDVGLVGIGVKLSEDRINIRARLEEQEWPSWAKASHSAPGFARLTNNETYAFVRANIDLRSFARHLNRLSGDDNVSSFDEALIRAFGVPFTDGLLTTAGPGVFISFNKLRALSLMRALEARNPNAPAYLDALGAVVAFQLVNRDALVEYMRQIVERSEGLVRESEDGSALVYEIILPEPTLMEIVITDNFLLLLPGRQRSEVLSRLRAPGGSSLESVSDEQSRQLVTGTDGNGFWLAASTVIQSPLISAGLARFNVDQDLSNNLLNQIHGRVHGADGKVVIDVSLSLQPIE